MYDYASEADIRNYIIQTARAKGIDPVTALTVWKHEGGGYWQSTLRGGKFGMQEPSFGPYQLLRGGGDTGFGTGLGNQFEKQTGLRVDDPSTWQKQIDFALDHVVRNGWGAWMGAKAAGITGKEGVTGQPGAPTPTDAAVAAANPAQAEANARAVVEGPPKTGKGAGGAGGLLSKLGTALGGGQQQQTPVAQLERVNNEARPGPPPTAPGPYAPPPPQAAQMAQNAQQQQSANLAARAAAMTPEQRDLLRQLGLLGVA